MALKSINKVIQFYSVSVGFYWFFLLQTTEKWLMLKRFSFSFISYRTKLFAMLNHIENQSFCLEQLHINLVNWKSSIILFFYILLFKQSSWSCHKNAKAQAIIFQRPSFTVWLTSRMETKMCMDLNVNFQNPHPRKRL